ncbi:hypothetical protein D9M68_17620 [compost metagenome]
MTEIIRRSRMAANANTLIANPCKAGISWGTNNYPANSDPAWFAGTNAGPDASYTAAQFEAGNPNAQQAIDVLKYVANFFGSIRTTRIVIYRSHYSVGQTLVSDQTAVAWINYPIAFSNNVAMGFADGNDMDLDVFNNACNALYNTYYANCRAQVATLTRTICHTSCHSSCHSNRGRR